MWWHVRLRLQQRSQQCEVRARGTQYLRTIETKSTREYSGSVREHVGKCPAGQQSTHRRERLVVEHVERPRRKEQRPLRAHQHQAQLAAQTHVHVQPVGGVGGPIDLHGHVVGALPGPAPEQQLTQAGQHEAEESQRVHDVIADGQQNVDGGRAEDDSAAAHLQAVHRLENEMDVVQQAANRMGWMLSMIDIRTKKTCIT